MSDMWIDAYEDVGEQYGTGQMDRTEAESALRGLGLDPHEIAESLDEIDV